MKESEMSFSDASYSRKATSTKTNTFRSKIPRASKIVTAERNFLEDTRYDKYQQIEEK
ncbi:hypothetical protein IKI14_03600 [bacterium]|nr:hypothetical protein [bacterium]